MIADHEHGPTVSAIDGRNLAPEFGWGKFVDGGEHEVHGHLEFIAALAVVTVEFVDVGSPGLADEDGVRLVGNFAQLPQHLMNLGKIGVVFILHVGIALLVGAVKDGIVAQLGIFKEGVNGVEAEAGNAALVPPAGAIEHYFFNRGIAPVEVGLLGIEEVVIELIGGGIEGPSRTAED